MTLGLPWTARRSNQPILKEIDPEYSLEGLKLKPPDAKSRLTGKDPDAGETEGRRRRQQRRRWLESIPNSVDMNWSKLWKMRRDREAWHAAVHEKGWTRLSE